MYENENNNYHYNNQDGSYSYVYRRSDEPAYPQELKPVKKKAVLPWGKLIALMLVCALVGGLVGAGVMGIVSGGIGSKAEIAVSDRTVQEVELVKVDGKLWTARSLTGEVIPAGAHVQPMSIEGAKLMVCPVKEEQEANR